MILAACIGVTISAPSGLSEEPRKKEVISRQEPSQEANTGTSFDSTLEEVDSQKCSLAVTNESLEKRINSVLLLSSVGSQVPSQESKFAVRGVEKIFLYPVIKVENCSRAEYYCSASKIWVGRKLITTNPSAKSKKELERLLVEWYKIEPVISLFSPYKNVDERTGKWKGWAKVRYNKFFHEKTRGLKPMVADAVPLELRNYAGLGTMRFSIELKLGRRKLKTPDNQDLIRGGISDKVARVSYILDQSFRGWLTSYFNVPGIYGSSYLGRKFNKNHQTELYQGFDCADLVVGAVRHLDKRYKYTHADNLRKRTQYSQPFLLHRNGSITDLRGDFVELRYGKDIREGDLLFFADRNKKHYWHVAVLYKDLGPDFQDDVVEIFKDSKGAKGDGILNSHDLIFHYKHNGIWVEDLNLIFLKLSPKRIVFGRFR